jgi:hypothetical protein
MPLPALQVLGAILEDPGHAVEQVLVDERFVEPVMELGLPADLPDVDGIPKHVEEGLRRPRLPGPLPVAVFGQLVAKRANADRARCIPAEDPADDERLVLIGD